MRVAVGADLDLNLIDGSSVWLASLVKTLATASWVNVVLFAKCPLRREVLSRPLCDLENVTVLAPQQDARPLSPKQMLDRIEAEDENRPFDAIILRRFPLCTEAVHRSGLHARFWFYLTDIPQSSEKLDKRWKEDLRDLAKVGRHLLCQTEEMRSFLESSVRQARGKCLLLPPMIPPPVTGPPLQNADSDRFRIVYAGKFAPLWATLEMVEVFSELYKSFPNCELHVFGDKIHSPSHTPGFGSRVKTAFRDTPGLVWHGGLPREEVLGLMRSMQIGWSWRRRELDDSLELSTKLLEYLAAGALPLLNRNRLNEDLLGSSYPLFAQSPDEALWLLREAVENDRLIAESIRQGQRVTRRFTFHRVFRDCLEGPLRTVAGLGKRRVRTRISRESTKVLLAGHDFRFISRIGERLREEGIPVMEDRWLNHSEHDEARSRRLLREADIICCEWCLGNAVWYSEQRRPGQRLVIRFHLQERETEFPAKVKLGRRDRVIFVGEHIRLEAARQLMWPEDRTTTLGNYVDCIQFERRKLPGARTHLGMIGICPSRKGFHRALDLLEDLRSRDVRFRLSIKGKAPWEYDWLWRQEAEKSYYRKAMYRIYESPLLRNAVVFEGYGDDVAEWLRKIGFVLSLSDFESFHLAVAEGAASGARPIIRRWEGADLIYPPGWIYRDTSAATEAILDLSSEGSSEETRSCQDYVRRHYDFRLIYKDFKDILLKQ